MKVPSKIGCTAVAAVIAISLFTRCEQDTSLRPDDLYREGLAVEQIASRLNAQPLTLPEFVKPDLDDARTLANETIRFDDGGVCQIQDIVDLPGCVTGNFSDPNFAYFYTLDNAYFTVFQSLGPGSGLAAAGKQTYVVFRLYDPEENHMLVSPGNWWTKYKLGGNANHEVQFDLQTIRHVYGGDITLWFLQDGMWKYWAKLGVGNWNVSAYAKGITEFQIRSSSGESTDT